MTPYIEKFLCHRDFQKTDIAVFSMLICGKKAQINRKSAVICRFYILFLIKVIFNLKIKTAPTVVRNCFLLFKAISY